MLCFAEELCAFNIFLFPLSAKNNQQTVKNTKFSDWTINARSPCSDSQTVRSQCISEDNLDADELNLILTDCTASGFSCGNQKTHDPEKKETCPTKMKIRHECPTAPSKCFIKNLLNKQDKLTFNCVTISTILIVL